MCSENIAKSGLIMMGILQRQSKKLIALCKRIDKCASNEGDKG
jgi:hypothetical protein